MRGSAWNLLLPQRLAFATAPRCHRSGRLIDQDFALHYQGSTDFRHDQPDLTGVVLVNLGTPDAPTPAALRRYLAQFLGDRRVVELPRWLHLLLLHGVILRTRPYRSARNYAEIWTEQGSPLLIHSQSLAERVASVFAGDPQIVVALAMRYGEPSIPAVLERLRAQGLRRLLVVPLYPQYSGTTTASVYDVVFAVLRRWRFIPELRLVGEYFAEPDYIGALVARIAAHRAVHGAADRLLMSFHGIPRRYFLAGDPYFCECQATARAVATRLGLSREQYAVSFQSRDGPDEWLKPYTDQTLETWAREGVKSVQVVCPGFAVDCLETLEEIAVENRDRFLQHGGERFEYIPALNAGEDHVQLIAGLVRKHLAGWPVDHAAPDPAQREAMLAERARRRAEFEADAGR